MPSVQRAGLQSRFDDLVRNAADRGLTMPAVTGGGNMLGPMP